VRELRCVELTQHEQKSSGFAKVQLTENLEECSIMS